MKRSTLVAGLALAFVASQGIAATFHPLGQTPRTKVALPGIKASNRAYASSATVPLPWEADFSTLENLDDFKVVDANDDEKTWELTPPTVSISYNPQNGHDDWLICPGVYLESGLPYTIEFTAHTQDSTYEEKFEVMAGESSNPSALTMEVLPLTTIVGTQNRNYSCEFVPTKTGVHYFGFHALSEADRYRLHLTRISIASSGEGTAPAGVVDLTVTPTGAFDLSAIVSMKAPTTTVGGNPLSAIDRVEVTRDGSQVRTFQNPAPGEELSFTDNVPSAGTYTYSATVYTSEGAGRAMVVQGFIGATIPAMPENVIAEELSVPGQMRLSWSAVTRDDNGNPIPAGRVKYIVLDLEGNVIDTDIAGTEFYGQTSSNTQTFLQFVVAAYTEAGYGEGNVSNMLAIGPAYTNFHESFPQGVPTKIWAVGYVEGDAEWNPANNESIEEISASDGDNGYVFMMANYKDSTAGLISGKITLPASAPAIAFDLFNFSSAALPNLDCLTLEVSDNGYEWVPVSELSVSEMCGTNYFSWEPVAIGLHGYEGKTVQIKFQVKVNNYGFFIMDNIHTASLSACDIAAKGLTAPRTAYAGEEVTLNLTVANLGASDITGYDIDIYTNGVKTDRIAAPAIHCGEWQTLDIPYPVSNVAEGDQEIRAVVGCAEDTNPGNDVSNTVVIEPIISKLPYISDLTGSVDGAIVTLNWNEPYTATFTPGIDEDFESAEDFAHSFGNFTFIDRDQKPVGGVMGTPIPGINPDETLASFFVLNSSYEQFGSGFTAHSGDKYLATMFPMDNSPADDWLITPRLNGAAQIIGFFARSKEEYYAEKMDVLYSMGSLNPDDFIKIMTVDRVPGQWTEYNVPVPTGTRYMAIRSYATGAFMLLVDDFHYADENCPIGIDIAGYNVYLDGVRINGRPITEKSYSFTTPAGSHDYCVTTLYDGYGESKGSNVVTLVSDGSGVKAAMASSSVKAGRGRIDISGMEGADVRILLLDGRLVSADSNIGNFRTFALAPGVYIVNVGSSAVKVIVK